MERISDLDRADLDLAAANVKLAKAELEKANIALKLAESLFNHKVLSVYYKYKLNPEDSLEGVQIKRKEEDGKSND